MSMITVASVPRMSASELSKLLLQNSSSNLDAPSPPLPYLAIVDVRDDDYIGGHIKHSIHRSSTSLVAEPTAAGAMSSMTKLVEDLKDMETVVFHCSLSQQRGPGMAMKYLRHREALKGRSKGIGHLMKENKIDAEGRVDVADRDGQWEDVDHDSQVKEQKVYILDKGFVGWQEKYGEDTRLTEGFRKELWR